ncbi:uncharacterized protein LOC113332443 [Papaver somniferum]|uniref:uncharacterized protein LOC113332443 n=1 Tax=Papaver somniferum TaxID=3469 RepID=UPI000E6F48AC|nr:uncharacterized protein LOC113332443 [Papaver somniferum]
MVRIESTVEQAARIRRSRRIVGRRRAEDAESPRSGERTNQRNETQPELPRDPEQHNDIDHDRVSVHTARTNTTEEDMQENGGAGLIQGNEENMTIEELRQRLMAERRRENEERANLIQRNNDLREENIILQERRSRSITRARSRTRTSKSSSRQSRSNRQDARRRQPLSTIEENIQVDDNLQDQREGRRAKQDLANNRYAHPRDLLRGQQNQRDNRRENASESRRTHHNS